MRWDDPDGVPRFTNRPESFMIGCAIIAMTIVVFVGCLLYLLR